MMLEEKAKRDELTLHFQTAVREVIGKMEQQAEEKVKDHSQLQKFAPLHAHSRGSLIDKLVQYKDQLEKKCTELENLANTRAAEKAASDERALRALEFAKAAQETVCPGAFGLTEEMQAMEVRIEAATASEAEMKAQLGLYVQKFDEFHSLVGQSHEAITMYRTESDKAASWVACFNREGAEAAEGNGKGQGAAAAAAGAFRSGAGDAVVGGFAGLTAV